MEKKRMIPEDFMTVGQLAQKMGTTVRTLQYYDREGSDEIMAIIETD